MIATYCGLFLLSTVFFFFAENQLGKFLRRNNCIVNERSLQEYRSIVRLSTLLAILQTIFAFSTLFLGTILVLITTLSFAVFISCANGVVFSLYRERIRLEKKARSLPTADRDLELKYRRISEAWRKKILKVF